MGHCESDFMSICNIAVAKRTAPHLVGMVELKRKEGRRLAGVNQHVNRTEVEEVLR